MRSYKLVEAGLTSENQPVFKFVAELHDGADFDGKFHIQFAAVEQAGERRFALNSPQGALAVFDADDSRELAHALADGGEYIVAADYENRSWEEPDAVATVLMGRDVGRDVDFRQAYTLDPEEHATIREIADILGSPNPA